MDLDTTRRDPTSLVGELMHDDELDQVIGGMYVDDGPGRRNPRRRRLSKSCRRRPSSNKKSICVG